MFISTSLSQRTPTHREYQPTGNTNSQRTPTHNERRLTQSTNAVRIKGNDPRLSLLDCTLPLPASTILSIKQCQHLGQLIKSIDANHLMKLIDII
ncbi:MAG: hypothetical protein ACPHE1_01730, partial [Pseudomonadales bacterium]